jgi:membrane protease YdiL (CAAX protease family)
MHPISKSFRANYERANDMQENEHSANLPPSEVKPETTPDNLPQSTEVSDNIASTGEPVTGGAERTQVPVADAESPRAIEGTAPALARSSQRPIVVRVFIGRSGLRAGWRLLIYFLMVAALGVGVAFLVRRMHVHRTPDITAWNTVISDGIMLAIFVIPSLIMGAFEKRSLADYYLPLRRAFGARFWEGVLWGFGALSLLLVSIRATGDFYFGQLTLHGTQLLYYAAVWALAFTLVGLAEEYSMRGYSLFTLATGTGFWPAAIIMSILFAGLHTGNPGENPLGIVDVVAIALFFCLTLRRTGNLWFAIGFHAAWDWGETFFYGVPNSGMIPVGHMFSPTFRGTHWVTGGSAGPEGSAYALILICVISVLFAIRFRKKALA